MSKGDLWSEQSLTLRKSRPSGKYEYPVQFRRLGGAAHSYADCSNLTVTGFKVPELRSCTRRHGPQLLTGLVSSHISVLKRTRAHPGENLPPLRSSPFAPPVKLVLESRGGSSLFSSLQPRHSSQSTPRRADDLCNSWDGVWIMCVFNYRNTTPEFPCWLQTTSPLLICYIVSFSGWRNY